MTDIDDMSEEDLTSSDANVGSSPGTILFVTMAAYGDIVGVIHSLLETSARLPIRTALLVQISSTSD